MRYRRYPFPLEYYKYQYIRHDLYILILQHHVLHPLFHDMSDVH